MACPSGSHGGHDIDQVQVAMAVVDFCKEYGLEYSMQDRDFWIWKPMREGVDVEAE